MIELRYLNIKRVLTRTDELGGYRERERRAARFVSACITSSRNAQIRDNAFPRHFCHSRYSLLAVLISIAVSIGWPSFTRLTFEQQLIRTFCHRPLPQIISSARRDRTGRNLGDPPLADALVGSIRSPCLSAASPAKREAFVSRLADLAARRATPKSNVPASSSETFPRNYRH